jgi:hypothetical protein
MFCKVPKHGNTYPRPGYAQHHKDLTWSVYSVQHAWYQYFYINHQSVENP